MSLFEHMFDIDFVAFLIETEETLSELLCGVINSHTNSAEILDIAIATNYDKTVGK